MTPETAHKKRFAVAHRLYRKGRGIDVPDPSANAIGACNGCGQEYISINTSNPKAHCLRCGCGDLKIYASRDGGTSGGGE